MALGLIVTGVLMVMLDTTIVNVALPSIRADLSITEAALGAVVNLYLLTFGVGLLPAGRLGDRFGNRKLFLIGLAIFTSASLMCGLAATYAMLVAGRALQGLGSAIVVAVSLALILDLFAESRRRAKALSVYAAASGAGGSIGLMLGGVLTHALGWRSVFLVNLPVGLAVIFLMRRCMADAESFRSHDEVLTLDGDHTHARGGSRADVHAFDEVSSHDETRLGEEAARSPTAIGSVPRFTPAAMGLSLFRRRTLAFATLARVLWSAGAATWLFVSTLYLQRVLGFTPLEVALTVLPANLLMAAFSLGLSARLVSRFGVKMPFAFGFLLGAAGLALLACVPVDGELVAHVLPGMLLVGIGAGISMTPLLLAGTVEAAPGERGLVSGLVHTAALIGGALGLAILVGLSSTHAAALLAAGVNESYALTAGYRLAFAGSAVCALAAAVIGIAFIRLPGATFQQPAGSA